MSKPFNALGAQNQNLSRQGNNLNRNSLDESRRIENPLNDIMDQAMNPANNNNLNFITWQNQTNPSNNSNNNNLNAPIRNNPINPIRNMNQGQNLDDMLNEMSKVLLNLQSDMSRVNTNINQLNLLISNIRRYQANNNMNNGMISNNNNMMGNVSINNNIIGGNNMPNFNVISHNMGTMNSMVANNKMCNNMMIGMMGNNMGMMNNFTNMNNLNNTNFNLIRNDTNMNIEPSNNNPQSFNVNFRDSGVDIKDKNNHNKAVISVEVKENEKISDIIQKYIQKSSNFENNLKFVFNGKELNLSLTAREAGLTNSSNIYVVRKKI